MISNKMIVETEQDGMDCKVVILPTTNERVGSYITLSNGKLLYMPFNELYQGDVPQHLYFTSNEQIKEGDWCMYNDGGSKDIRKAIRCYNGRVYFSETTFAKKELLIKIIACTDLSLPLPSIPISWIKDVYVPSQGNVNRVKVVDPKKALTKNGVIIIVRDEVEKVQKPKVADKIIFFCRYCDNEVSVRDAACDDCIGITPTQRDTSLDAAELKKAIQLKNEGWANSLEFKIWSLAYENNSEDNYRSVIAEVEKLQPKIIEQSDVDKRTVQDKIMATTKNFGIKADISDADKAAEEYGYINADNALSNTDGLVEGFKAGASWQQSDKHSYRYLRSEQKLQLEKFAKLGINTTGQTFEQMVNSAIMMLEQSHPPVTSMSAEELNALALEHAKGCRKLGIEQPLLSYKARYKKALKMHPFDSEDMLNAYMADSRSEYCALTEEARRKYIATKWLDEYKKQNHIS